MTARFITLEGGEGVGKSTNVALVVELIRQAGHRVVATREPGGTPLAEQIRDLLLDVREEVVADKTELLLIFAARAQHLSQVIRPALQRNEWVVCDRFTDASYAYQGGGRGMDQDTIAALEQLVHGDLQPDLTIYLDVPVEISLQRISGRPHDRFEREQTGFFERVRASYLERAKADGRFRVIDAQQDLAAVQSQIRKALGKYLDRAGNPGDSAAVEDNP